MADSFDKFMEERKEKFVPNIAGAFDCQECDEFVREAYHDRKTGLLVWKCSEGHVSHVKEFNV